MGGAPTAISSQQLMNMDAASLLHPFTAIRDQQKSPAPIMESGSGCRITDTDGRNYLDGAAGLWCVNVGYGRLEISDAIAAQSRELAYFHTFNGISNRPSIVLSERLLARAPQGMARVFFGNSGSDANDTAIKLLWHYNICRGLPNKRKIISRSYAYHGVSIASGSLTGIPMVHQNFGLPLPFVRHVSRPDLYRDAPARHCATETEYVRALAEELEALILAEGPDTVAGFIAEPVMGTGGVHVPPKGYFPAIQEVLDRHDICLVADEVITGFGRTGHWFASEALGMRPDIVLTAKGLTSGYLPLSAVLVGERVWSAIEQASSDGRVFAHGFTYSGHPTCAAAALANLDILEREDLVSRVADIAPTFSGVFNDTLGECALVGDIRATGLMMGIELVADRAERRAFPSAERVAARVALAARNAGILVRALPNSDVIALSPPFTVSVSELAQLAEGVSGAIKKVAAELGVAT
jgi:L-2,4-diaminobutyrate transaminase